ncbi:MAG TPA: hypothetical protein VK689_07770, partial [Armatimonadota bacterium]|nr:hypothetical protein [Armatimonadota bacterium]
LTRAPGNLPGARPASSPQCRSPPAGALPGRISLARDRYPPSRLPIVLLPSAALLELRQMPIWARAGAARSLPFHPVYHLRFVGTLDYKACDPEKLYGNP